MVNRGDTLPANLVLLAGVAAIVVLLPLLGARVAGIPTGRYLEFPPTTQHVVHAGFSLPVFLGYTLFGVGVVAALVVMGIRSRSRGDPPTPIAKPFPWWGWLGVIAGAVFWMLSWNRFSWFTPFQPHTFLPLWLSYITVVNALAYRHCARCMILHETRYFICLFPISAGFWWLFEILNRFVQNWYYTGSEYPPLTYFALATLSFSTVLPAVLGTRDWLMTAHWLSGGFTGLPSWAPRRPRTWSVVGLILAGGSLAAISVWPDQLFPLLWVFPLLLMICIRQISGRTHPLTPIAQGEWRPVVAAAGGALICGWFWEMWNVFSLAKWHYAIPYVQALHIFEMPLPGYAGYIPFGLECAAVGMLLHPLKTADKNTP